MLDIYELVMEFYSLKQLEVDIEIDEFKKSHMSWLSNFEDYKQHFTDAFHKMIWDYTILACAGELRHAKNCSTKYHPNIPEGVTRGAAMTVIKKYTKESVTKVVIDLFGPDCVWKSGYGGKAWHTIALALDKVHKLPKDVWIDHCVDLAHNNGSYFNKTSARVFEYNYGSKLKNFLDWKRANPVWGYKDYYNMKVKCSAKLAEMISNANKLRIVSDIDVTSHHIANYTGYYAPIKWGTEVILPKYIECNTGVLSSSLEDYRYEQEAR